MTENDDSRLEKAASAAYMIALGSTVEDAAEAIGRTRRTVTRWRADADLWGRAEDLAHERWLSGLTAKVKARLAERLGSDDVSDDLVKWVAERLITELAGPSVSVEANVNHKVSGQVDHHLDSPRERLAEKIRRIRENRAELEQMEDIPGRVPKALPPGSDDNDNERED